MAIVGRRRSRRKRQDAWRLYLNRHRNPTAWQAHVKRCAEGREGEDRGPALSPAEIAEQEYEAAVLEAHRDAVAMLGPRLERGERASEIAVAFGERLKDAEPLAAKARRAQADRASARQWSRSADTQQQADTLAGLHSDYALFVLDEAGSIPQAVVATAEAVLATGLETKLAIAGNPTSLDGPLYRACVTDRQLWTVIEVTGDPDDPKRSPRIDLQWAKQQIATYGRDNAWVRVNVLGQFPPASLNALLGVEEVQAAMNRHLRPDTYTWAQKRLGIDVARFGDDRTVIFPRQGLASFRPVVMRHARGSSVSTDITARVLMGKAKWGSEVEIFDATGGWSAGCVDILRASGYTPIDVQFHARALDPRYANRRAEMWFTMAEWVRSGAALPPILELVAELTVPTYTFVNGKFQLEPKEAVKARLGRSPDLADALALTFGLPEMPAALAGGLEQRSVGRALCDFDPLDDRYLDRR